MFWYLRIAFSVVIATLGAILLAMWLRSYVWWDNAAWGATTKKGLMISSQSGAAVLTYYNFEGTPTTLREWDALSLPSPSAELFPIGGMDEAFAGFSLHHSQSRPAILLSIPYWFLLPLSIVIAAFPWIQWRFSLRTLVITTTLIAVVLGIIAVS